MAIKKECALAAVEWMTACDLTDSLKARKTALQAQLAEVNASITSAQADEDAKLLVFKQKAAAL